MTEMTREQKYATTRDEELVLLAQSGDEEAFHAPSAKATLSVSPR